VAIGSVVLLLIVVLIEGVIILLPRGAVEEVGATLSVLEGKVFVQRGGQGDWIEMAEEFVVQPGDRIRVTDASEALLTFVEDTTTELRVFTELTIEELQLAEGQPVVVRLDLQLGEIWNRIGALPADSLHEITTVAARVISHGSEYGVAVNEVGTTWLTGHEGEMNVMGAGQAVQLRPGDMLVVEPGSPPVPYSEVAVALPSRVAEPAVPVSCTLESVDLWSFGNEPLPTGTPANTPTATPTSTATPTPTATPTRTSCPSLGILLPSEAYPRRAFGIQFERTGGLPHGYDYVLEFSEDEVSWNRLQPVPASVRPDGPYYMAEAHGQGAGTFHWRVCLVSMADPTGPSVCCSPPHRIIHSRPEHEEEEEEEPTPRPIASPYPYGPLRVQKRRG